MSRAVTVLGLAVAVGAMALWLGRGSTPETSIAPHLRDGPGSDIPGVVSTTATAAPAFTKGNVSTTGGLGLRPSRSALTADQRARINALRDASHAAWVAGGPYSDAHDPREFEIRTERMTPRAAAEYMFHNFNYETAQAIEYARRGLAAEPESFGLGMMLAQLLRHPSRDEAIAEYARLLEMRPRSGEALRGYGEAAMDSDPTAAVDRLVAATDVDPGDSRSYAYLGQAYERLGRADDAVAAYRAAYATGPQSGSGTWLLRAATIESGGWTFPPLDPSAAGAGAPASTAPR
ncbi:tetratricopeptide repeat protein [Candidatus Poribacteria bacterium]|jgi:tetratricopeptide (TPR) repeat protein|nr:tetratricopeptide repeat protein [Candidatus Poribacteria bacterium]MBT5531530.1 tetratricopeptide repeat protein [Candidatus Poribacteria bacterium]MBT5711418.1 tetratricopeptide repeat protein [Candidatus Poribacteria bacterium]MBT7099990.1 tetratricopeptide repeat protein [Candidatus Poribacteria bacterium]MBT7808877.1 tetratricopeptide repeat protein [Candidatus Poribacteria bacterium]